MLRLWRKHGYGRFGFDGQSDLGKGILRASLALLLIEGYGFCHHPTGTNSNADADAISFLYNFVGNGIEDCDVSRFVRGQRS